MGRRFCIALLAALFWGSCENKFRAQRAPADLTLPQPDRGPCGKAPPPILYVRLPHFMSEAAREKQYCAPLKALLEKQKLGSVQSVAPAPRSDAGFAGCAVHTPAVDQALVVLTRELGRLKAPRRTVIEELCGGVGSVHTLN